MIFGVFYGFVIRMGDDGVWTIEGVYLRIANPPSVLSVYGIKETHPLGRHHLVPLVRQAKPGFSSDMKCYHHDKQVSIM